MTVRARRQRLEQLTQTLRERIVVLDGAMGTMIQSYELSENEFRGERFQNHTGDLRGNNDLLNLTRPHLILPLIHISEPTRPRLSSYAVFCVKKKIQLCCYRAFDTTPTATDRHLSYIPSSTRK